MVERYRIFAFTTFYRADSTPRPPCGHPDTGGMRETHAIAPTMRLTDVI